MAHETTPPINYPSVEIQGSRYEIRFGLGALFRLEEMGISANELDSFQKNGLPEGKAIRVLCSVLSATLGNQPNGSWKPIGKKPEEVADMLSPQDFAALLPVLQGGLAKASPVENSEATPPAEVPPQQ